MWQLRQFSEGRSYRRPRRTNVHFVAKLTTLFFFLVSLGLVLSLVLFALVARSLPQPDKVIRRGGFATQIFDRNGKQLYDVFSRQRRVPVKIEAIPKYLKDATVAIEDKDFYRHQGFDAKGIGRAIFNIIIHRRLQGGSTLTQQLVKNVLLSSERTLIRKLKEFILALQIERKYTKDQILAMYLNETPYGGTAWGIEAAAETYFDKEAKDLTLAETVILAGLPQRPSYYSPFGSNAKAFIGRAEQVLRRMKEDGYISQEQEKKIKAELTEVKFASAGANLKAPHFIMYVRDLLTKKYGETLVEGGGLKVTTSLNLDLQEKAQAVLSDEVKKAEKLQITNGAAVVIDAKTGEILAMIGSKDYNDPNYDGKVNTALALRQPGSAIKPVTYVTALKRAYTPATLLMDTRTSFPGGDKPEYVPENYDGKERGPLQMRFALGNSINITAVKMLAKVGIREMLTTASDLGISTLAPTVENVNRLGLSVTLGGGEVRLLEITSAYAAFANSGYKAEPTAILRVEDKDGKVLEEFRPVTGKRVLSSEQAFLISDILADNSARTLTFGERSALVVSGYKVAVKTGTTNDRRDNWTIGWTPSLAVGVWVGNNDNSPMKKVDSGVSGAAPIWKKILLESLGGRESEDFIVPSGIVSAEVDSVSGYRAHDGFPSRVEYFIRGTEPSDTEGDPVHVKLKVCKGSGKLATPVDISRGDYDEKEYFIFRESDPTAFPGGLNKWQEGIDRWITSQTDSRHHPPTEYCESQNQVEVRIIEPQDQTQVGTNFNVRAEPISTNDITQVEIFANGESKAVISSPPYERKISLVDGTYTLRVKAKDNIGNEGQREIKIGVNLPWNWQPSPAPSPTPTVAPSPMPTTLPSPTFTPTVIPTPTP